jgi:hypothetical protein
MANSGRNPSSPVLIAGSASVSIEEGEMTLIIIGGVVLYLCAFVLSAALGGAKRRRP